MARARNIKPGFFTNDMLAEVPALGRILFQGLWCHADREGRLEDRPRKIKAEILPYDDCDIDALLNALASRGFVLRYQVEEARYIQVVNFTKHQNPHVKEPASVISAPDEHQTSLVQAPERPELAGLIPDSLNLIPDSRENPRESRDPLPEADMPPGLNKTAWEQWVDYRKQLRKPLKPVSMPATQRKLAAFGSDQAAVVEQSIANGWLGLFELKNGGKHETHQPIDNSAPARVRRAYEQREREQQPLNAERVD